MDYKQTTEYIFSQLPMYQRIGKAAYKADLYNTLALDEHFGHPHTTFKTIHVAGTNGKGSVSHMLASVLMEAGYKVGLYTSPHLKDFRERIKINEQLIPEQEVVDFVQNNIEAFKRIKPSFFEMTVALAFDFFAKQKVDVAVIEVGLGGRLDSTNIITPELSVITNIGFDHTDLLGDTLKKIAAEKAGIVKPSVPVVVSQSQPETKDVFIRKAKECNAAITFADEHYKSTPIELTESGKRVFRIEKGNSVLFERLTLDLLGDYQQKNIMGVLASIDILKESGFTISTENIQAGLANSSKNTGLMGRWQILGQSPKIICDTGHNVDGITIVVNQLSRISYNKLHIVIGFVGDKDINGILELLPKDAIYYFTQASIPRALNAELLSAKAKTFGLAGKTYKTVKEAVSSAKSNASVSDLIFIGGSTFVVADALMLSY